MAKDKGEEFPVSINAMRKKHYSKYMKQNKIKQGC